MRDGVIEVDPRDRYTFREAVVTTGLFVLHLSPERLPGWGAVPLPGFEVRSVPLHLTFVLRAAALPDQDWAAGLSTGTEG
jgi:hypothetical protein